MSKRRLHQKDQPPPLRSIEGGLDSQDFVTDPDEELVAQRFSFLRSLEQAGMNTNLCKRLLVIAPNKSFEEVVDFLVTRENENNNSDEKDIFEHNSTLAKHILHTYETCAALASAEEESPEATDMKKQTYLKIHGEEKLTPEEKAILLHVLDEYTPQLKGLDMDDRKEVARIREIMLVDELGDKQGNVVSFSQAIAHRRKID